MGFLVGLGLLALFAAALMNPYGRRLLAVMLGIVVVLGGALALLIMWGEQNRVRQEAAEAAAERPR